MYVDGLWSDVSRKTEIEIIYDSKFYFILLSSNEIIFLPGFTQYMRKEISLPQTRDVSQK